MNFCLGQCYRSELETQLGLGIVVEVEHRRVGVQFSEEKRIYNINNTPLKRFELKAGETVQGKNGESFVVSEVKELNGLKIYLGENDVLPESELSLDSSKSSSSIFENFQQLEVGQNSDYKLRLEAQKQRNILMSSPAWGLLGCRLDLVPHQLYIAHRALTQVDLPRMMLSDEVGLGKTIEAGFIYHALRQRNRISRTLVLVPEALRHQWMVEMYRRFNQMFSVMDSEAYNSVGIEAIDIDSSEKNNKETLNSKSDINPFDLNSEVICDFDFLLKNPEAMAACVSCDWDLIIVDEAHHLHSGNEESKIKYDFVRTLAHKAPGVLLLTATPHQLEPRYHFDRLQILDPDRYHKFEAWQVDQDYYNVLAGSIAKLDDDNTISWEDLKLAFSHSKNSKNFLKTLEMAEKSKISPSGWLRAAGDVFGTGSNLFRNSRKRIGGFPTRHLKSYALEKPKAIKKLSQDPRLEWLANFVKENSDLKVLCLCSQKEMVLEIQKEIAKLINVNMVVFHEDMTMVELDRAAAWFADEDGARLLVASEIGSEGRNFQVAQNMVMFDLPAMPSLLEQRIGRLDRIGQRDEFTIHVPYLENDLDEKLFIWYHQAIDLFKQPLAGADQLWKQSQEIILDSEIVASDEKFQQMIEVVKIESENLRALEETGRDRLLEYNSHNDAIAQKLISEIKKFEETDALEKFNMEILETYGVDTQVDEANNRWIVKPSSEMKIEAFPGLLNDGMSVTSSRANAMNREDIAYLSWEHPIAQGAMDLILSDKQAQTSFICWEGAPITSILCELVFVHEYHNTHSLGLEEIWSPKITRVLIDQKGNVCNQYLEDLDNSILIDGSISLLDEINPQLIAFENADVIGLQEAQAESKLLIKHALSELQKLAEEEKAHLLCLSGVLQREKYSDLEDDLSQKIKAAIDKIHKPEIRLDAMRIILAD